jgi:hypothetical protein
MPSNVFVFAMGDPFNRFGGQTGNSILCCSATRGYMLLRPTDVKAFLLQRTKVSVSPSSMNEKGFVKAF